MSYDVSEAEVIESLTDCGQRIEDYFVWRGGMFGYWDPALRAIRYCLEDDNALAAACEAFLRAKGWEYETAAEVDAHARRFGWEDWPGESAAAE